MSNVFIVDAVRTPIGKHNGALRSVRPDDVRQHPNAIVKMAKVIEAVENWGRAYEQKNTQDTACGKLVPKVNIGAIRGGVPFKRQFPVTELISIANAFFP